MAVRLWCDKEQLNKIRQAGLKVLEPKDRDYVIVLASKEQVDEALKDETSKSN